MSFTHEHNYKPVSSPEESSSFSQPTRPFTVPGQEIQPGTHPGAEQDSIQKKPNTTGMPDAVLQKMESQFNTDFSDVKIFPNSANAPKLGAAAYTQGNHIHFAPGRFNLTRPEGLDILKHELKHVEQQRRGIVKPTGQLKGLPINDDPALEKEAGNT